MLRSPRVTKTIPKRGKRKIVIRARINNPRMEANRESLPRQTMVAS